MSTQSIPQVIRFGFLEVKLDDTYPINPQFHSKGKLLYESGCVHRPEELKLGDESIIRGIVERQTNKSLPPYKVELHVSIYHLSMFLEPYEKKSNFYFTVKWFTGFEKSSL